MSKIAAVLSAADISFGKQDVSNKLNIAVSSA
jgi:hypothetical protein